MADRELMLRHLEAAMVDTARPSTADAEMSAQHHPVRVQATGHGTNRSRVSGKGVSKMQGRGAHRTAFTSSEDAALRRGIATHGFGRWAAILQDGGFRDKRTGVHLKDRARTLGLKA